MDITPNYDESHHKLTEMHDFSYKVSENKDVLEFTGSKISGTVSYERSTDMFIISGQLNVGSGAKSAKFWAPNPIGRNYSYAGSGLPFPTSEIAYENTVNKGNLSFSNSTSFTIKVKHPNSYYINQGKTLIKPHIHFKFDNDDKVFSLIISDNLPYRSLTNLPDQPIRSTGR